MKLIQKGLAPIKTGFTLVELLIVISLLGAIALIVIAAINPIEQSNRARDARFKADSSQLLSAIERYYAAQSTYPWVNGTTVTSESIVGWLTSGDSSYGGAGKGIGLCGDAASPCADGLLITNNELLSAFKSRDFVSKIVGSGDEIRIGKQTGSQSSVYSCFTPKSLSTKNDAITRSKVYVLNAGTGGRSAPGAGLCTASTDWVANGCYVCVPE